MPPQPTRPADPHLSSRVDRIEVSVNALHEDFAGIKTDVRSLANSVSSGFESLRKENAVSKQTNWGWIAAFIGIGVTVTAYISSSLAEPLKTFDQSVDTRLHDIRQHADDAWEQSIRNDERIKILERRQQP